MTLGLPTYDGSAATRFHHARFLNRLANAGQRVGVLPGPRPTAAQLEKHAARFGPALVAETAAELGVGVAVERKRRQRGKRGPSRVQRVATLLAAGHDVDTIAEMEELTPARARRYVAKAKAAA